MWWQPLAEEEVEIRSQVERLSAYLVNRRPGYHIVHGVGSLLIEGGLRVPLLVVESYLDTSRAWVPGLLGAYTGGFLSWLYNRLLVPYSAASDALSRFLAEWEIPLNTRVLFLPRPRALQRRGSASARFNRDTATVGVVIALKTGETTFVTVGHLVPGLGSIIQVRRRLLGLFPRTIDIATVAAHSDPRMWPGALPTPGYDISVAVLRHEDSLQHTSITGLVRPQEVEVRRRPEVLLCGAISGIRPAFVIAPLSVVDAGDRMWERCWAVVGQQGWAARPGDSGAAAFTVADGKLLGHLVGGAGYSYRSFLEVGYVQDITGQIEFLRENFGMNFSGYA